MACPYCPPHVVDRQFDVDHVIPAKLGGTLTVPSHRTCNGLSAEAVDNPFMEIREIELLRGLSGVKNTRTGRRRGAQFGARLGDDAPALLHVTPEGVEIEQKAAGVAVPDGKGGFVFTLPPGDAREVARRTEQYLERMQAENPGKTVQLVDQRSGYGDIEVDLSWQVARWVWPRFAAKVALAVLAETMPPEWRGSDAELFLLMLFLTGRVYGAEEGISAVPTRLPEGMRYLHYPWEHVILVDSETASVRVTVILFGELVYSLRIATDLEPVGTCAWLCDYREPRPVTFDSVAAYRLAMIERNDLLGWFGHLRPDRPVARLLTPLADARLPGSDVDDLRQGWSG